MAKRLTDKEKKEIIAYYTECQNYTATARKFNISDNAVRKIVKKDNNSSEKFEQKKEENTQSVLDKFESLANVKNNILNNSLMTIAQRIQNGEVSTSDLIRIYGIMVDKEINYKALSKDNSEEEKNISKVKDILVQIKKVSYKDGNNTDKQ